CRRICGAAQENGAFHRAAGRAPGKNTGHRSRDQMMKRPAAGLLSILLVAALAPGAAQEPQGKPAKTPKAEKTDKTPKPYTSPPIFTATTPIEFTLIAPYKQIKKDRYGTPPYRPAEIMYKGDSGMVRIPLRVRTRGIWRRKNCDIPPLRLNFWKDSVKKTWFR